MKIPRESYAWTILAKQICENAKDIHDLAEYDGFVWKARNAIKEILECCESRQERMDLLTQAQYINNARRQTA